MNSVILTHGYFLEEDEKEKQIMRPYPPLGILSISAYLRAQGIPNSVFDTTFSSKGLLLGHLLSEQPTYLGIYVNLITRPFIIELMAWVRKQSILANTRVILGGPDTRHNADRLLGAGADFIVIGEGEQTMEELIVAIERGDKDFRQIPGIAFAEDDGEVVRTPERTHIKSIDLLPVPARDQIDLQLYFDAWQAKHNERSITISTMRGCPYTCKWCSRAVYGLSYRRRSPENVVNEIQELMRDYPFDRIWFVDDVFTISHKWLGRFAEVLSERDVDIQYECISRADRMGEHVVKLLRDTGCYRVWIGAESGSQKVIDLMDRRVAVTKVRETIQMAASYGIETGTFIMLGYPGETEADIEETISHLKEANPDLFTITVAYPIKGTELYAETQDQQIHPANWEESTDREIDFVRMYPGKYYRFALLRVFNEVHFYKRRLDGAIDLMLFKFKLKSLVGKLGMWWVRTTGTVPDR